jgi:hypothetical protein
MNLNIRKNGGFFEAESRLWYANATDDLRLELTVCVGPVT